MNKGKIKYIAAAAMLCFSAVSCGSKAGSQVTGSTSSGTSATTAETATEAASETTAATTTAAPTEETTAAEVSDEHLADAVRLFEAINTAEMLRTGAGVETDNELAKEFTVKENGKDTDMIFFKVTDSRFSSTDDVKKLLSDSFSGTLLEKYKGIYEGDSASFREYGGYLYLVQSDGSKGLEYAGQPEMTESSDTSFTAAVPVNNFGVVEKMTVKAVKEDDKWKASSFTIGKHKENERK